MITDDIFYLQLKTEDRHELVVPVYITSEEFEMLNTKNAKFQIYEIFYDVFLYTPNQVS